MIATLKIVYIDFGIVYESNSNSGIERKKLSQIIELEKIGSVKRLTFSPQGKNGILRKLSRRLPFFPSMFPYTINNNVISDIDVVYLRRACIDSFMIRLLNQIRKINPKVIILFEIPTFPYDKEIRGINNYPLLLKEKWNRKKLYKFVDRIVLVTSKENKIFGIPTIQSLNGIDFCTIALRKINHFDYNEIHAIIVGNFTFYHGIDRIIEGMINYCNSSIKQKPEVYIHIVGSGKEIEAYQEECKKAKIDKYVVFYGSLCIQDVNRVYDKVSIAINSIARHRVTGTNIDSSIKSREYGAKGLPVVTEEGIPIDYLPRDYPYVLTIPADDSPLDVFSIINFHRSIYENKNPEIVAQEIRSIAENRCSSEAMMRPILEYIKREKTISCSNRDVSSSILS